MKWEKSNLSSRQVDQMDKKDVSLSEWAEEVANKVKGNENMSAPVIMAEVCKEMVKTRDIEKAKVIVANRLINVQ